MFKNYLASALGNLLKNKLFSAINITGLAIGLAACLAIALYVHNEISYDKHWSKADRLYRAVTSRTNGEGGFTNARNPVPLVPALRQYFGDEIEAAVQLQPYTREIQLGDTLVQTRVVEVDGVEIVDMFDFEVLSGDLASALEPGSIALSEDLARRFFGRLDVAGETLTLRVSATDAKDLRVGAVYRLADGNSILKEGLLQLPAMIAMDFAAKPDGWATRWNIINTFSYVLLAPGVSGEAFNARMPAFTDQLVNIADFDARPGARPSDLIRFTFQNLPGTYLNSSFDGYGERGSKIVVLAFSAIALLVLAIGCINFIVLSTAKAVQRAREVAVRKTAGATRHQLVLQYLSESFFIVLPAMLIALMLVELLLPFFEGIVGKNLDTSFSAPAAGMAVLALAGIVALAGGFYPALVLSHYRPAATLRGGRSSEPRSSRRLRDVLVAFQFSVMIALMTGAFVIYAQVAYAMNRNPGFNAEDLAFVDVFRLSPAEQNLLKQRIGELPEVSAVSLSGYRPLNSTGNSENYFPFAREDGTDVANLPAISVGAEFFQTYEMAIVAGREFSDIRDLPSPIHAQDFQGSVSQSSIILNESAAKSLGFASPPDALGAQLSTTTRANDATHAFTVVGIAADTQFYNPRSEPRPEAYLVSAAQGSLIDAIVVRFQGDTQRLRSQLEATWRSVVGEVPFTVSFMDQTLAAEFARERSEARLLFSFALLAIVIACLGLFGSASFNVERRTKEIGIRKVMGAEVMEIVRLLVWQFSRPVLLANLAAWPIAFWGLLSWLERFTYRIDAWVLLPICAGAGLIALCIAWLTVGGTAAKAATQKPVLALRYE